MSSQSPSLTLIQDTAWLGRLPMGDREPLRLYIRERLDELV